MVEESNTQIYVVENFSAPLDDSTRWANVLVVVVGGDVKVFTENPHYFGVIKGG